MPSFDQLKAVLQEVESLKHSDEYNLRIAASMASTALAKMSDPIQYRAVIQSGIGRIREITKLYGFMDAGLARIHDELGAWQGRLRPGPRAMEENPFDNPIHLPGGDELPGAAVHQFAVQHKYSRDFSEEMNDDLIEQDWRAATPEQVHFWLSHMAWRIKDKGTVYLGTQEKVDPVRQLFRQHEIPYDKYPRGKYADAEEFIIWVPRDNREEARNLLKEKGFAK